MKRLKVITILGTRPEIIRLSRVIALLDRHCEHCLVHTGQNYDFELNEVFFQQLEIRRPDHFLNAARDTVAATIGQVIATADAVIKREQPDAMLVLGDTNSSLAVIAAKRRKVPIFHMEAGNRSFDQRVPEEINRKIVDHVADINLTYSDIARDYLLREGFAPDRVIKIGSPMREVLDHYAPQIATSAALSELGLEPQGFYLVSVHREENVDDTGRLSKLARILEQIVADRGLPVIVSTHPRTRKRIEQAGLRFPPQVRLLKPLGFVDYIRLQSEARAVLSDSGTITEESSLLNFPALNLRDAHERPEGMEEGAVMMVGLNPERIRQGLAILDEQQRGIERQLRPVQDYLVDNVSAKVLRILLSYTDYVNKVVWRKDARE